MDLKNLFPEGEENAYPSLRPETPEITYPYPLYKTDDLKNKSQHLKPNQVNFVVLHGIRIVSLIMEGKERLCLAQISNTLLKDYSYNEIHNRRVALGITCVQCTPVQLEILRRAGAMPISSRRCGMITKREAERLCKSFLGDNSPPKLPDNFAFEVYHECAWGCRGQFVPSRYNSSRAKCIKCHYCSIFFSPNKFVFHSHRLSDSDKYVQPDAANFNSWRRHTKLLGDPGDVSEEIVYAWEDIKAMFNGGTRKRMSGGNFPASSTQETKRPANRSLGEESPLFEERSSSNGRKRKGGSKVNGEPRAKSPPSMMKSNASSLESPPAGSLPDYFWPHPPSFPFSYPFLWPHHPPPLPQQSGKRCSVLPSLQHLVDGDGNKKTLEDRVNSSSSASKSSPPLYHAENLLKSNSLRPGLDFMHWIESRRSLIEGNTLMCANRLSAFKPLPNNASSSSSPSNNETCEVSTTVDKEDDREEVIDVETTTEDKIKKEKLEEPQDFSVQKMIK